MKYCFTVLFRGAYHEALESIRTSAGVSTEVNIGPLNLELTWVAWEQVSYTRLVSKFQTDLPDRIAMENCIVCSLGKC